MSDIPVSAIREILELRARLQSLEQELSDAKADALRLHKDKMAYLDAKIALEQELAKRDEWLEWALSELSTILQSNLVRGMEGSPKGHLEHIAMIRSAMKEKP